MMKVLFRFNQHINEHVYIVILVLSCMSVAIAVFHCDCCILDILENEILCILQNKYSSIQNKYFTIMLWQYVYTYIMYIHKNIKYERSFFKSTSFKSYFFLNLKRFYDSRYNYLINRLAGQCNYNLSVCCAIALRVLVLPQQ